MSGYSIKLPTSRVDIQYSKGFVQKGWITFSINKNGIYVYISRDNDRVYWKGSKNGTSSKLSIKFNDNKQMITINSSNKITFQNDKDYEKIKQKTIHYKLMKEDENSVTFDYK
jgi:hypothetical protein